MDDLTTEDRKALDKLNRDIQSLSSPANATKAQGATERPSRDLRPGVLGEYMDPEPFDECTGPMPVQPRCCKRCGCSETIKTLNHEDLCIECKVRDTIRTCRLCGKPTMGSIGAAGLRWKTICQPCKDSEDKALEQRIAGMTTGMRTVDPKVGKCPRCGGETHRFDCSGEPWFCITCEKRRDNAAEDKINSKED